MKESARQCPPVILDLMAFAPRFSKIYQRMTRITELALEAILFG